MRSKRPAAIIAAMRRPLTGILAILAGFCAIPLPAQPAPSPQPLRINVNTASREQLMTLPGVGESEARRIVAGRPYKNFPELERKARLSASAIQRIQPRLVFAESAAPERRSTPPVVMRPVSASGSWSPPPRPAPLPYAEKVDLNSAAQEELVSQAHLDPMTAMRIVRARPYRKLADLKKAGFTQKQILELSHYAKVGPPLEK